MHVNLREPHPPFLGVSVLGLAVNELIKVDLVEISRQQPGETCQIRCGRVGAPWTLEVLYFLLFPARSNAIAHRLRSDRFEKKQVSQAPGADQWT